MTTENKTLKNENKFPLRIIFKTEKERDNARKLMDKLTMQMPEDLRFRSVTLTKAMRSLTKRNEKYDENNEYSMTMDAVTIFTERALWGCEVILKDLKKESTVSFPYFNRKVNKFFTDEELTYKNFLTMEFAIRTRIEYELSRYSYLEDFKGYKPDFIIRMDYKEKGILKKVKKIENIYITVR